MREKTYRILFLHILAVMIVLFGTRNGRTASSYFQAGGDNVTITLNPYSDSTATEFKRYYDIYSFTAIASNSQAESLYSKVAINTPEITSPTPGSQLTGDSQKFTWTANGAAVEEWGLYVGSVKEARNYCDSGNLSTTSSYTCKNLPTDGSQIYVTLWYRLNGVWETEPYQYTAYDCVGCPPKINSPIPGSTLTGATREFTWTANNAAVAGWWLNVGSAEGTRNYCDSGNLSTTSSYTCKNLPTDGSQIYVTLRYRLNGVWKTEPYQYTAYNGGGGGTTDITSPTPGSKLTGTSQDFT